MQTQYLKLLGRSREEQAIKWTKTQCFAGCFDYPLQKPAFPYGFQTADPKEKPENQSPLFSKALCWKNQLREVEVPGQLEDVLVLHHHFHSSQPETWPVNSGPMRLLTTYLQ